jgi:hypothetical protein
MTEKELPMKELPNFSPQTRVFFRGSKDYEQHAYQYGTSSHQDNTMVPAAIIYPKTIKDIISSVKYAKETGIGIAVRTGGHQYSGASSTSGNNIQLDLSDTFQSVVRDFRYNHATKLLRVGISFSILELQSLLRNMKMFIPAGICANVHLGGHVQTGGYGMLTRAFGLLSDYVEGFEIVLANGNHEKVWKPNSPFAPKDLEPDCKLSKENNDLFWAVLGGSPGNFGILTHVLISPLHDEDYPDSRMMKVLTTYTKDKLENCLQILAEMSDDDNLPRNFDYSVTVFTNSSMAFYTKHAYEHSNKTHEALNLDEKMILDYPEQYGDGVPWAEEGKLATTGRPVHLMLILFHWINIKGDEEKFGEKEIERFEKVRKAMGSPILDAIEVNASEEFPNETRTNFIRTLLGDPNAHYPDVRYTNPTPISEMMRYYMWDDVREFAQPYHKRVYVTDKTNLSTNGWVQWISERADKIARIEDSESVNMQLQVQTIGGLESMYGRLDNCNSFQNNSHSWRNELTSWMVMDGFYDPKDKNALETVLKWQEENDECFKKGLICAKENEIFCDKDRRLLWATYGRHDDEDNGASLDSLWDKYYDSKWKYDKLVEIKRRVDPDYIFTANAFGIDATNAPEERKSMIVANGHFQSKNDSQSMEMLWRSGFSCGFQESSSSLSSVDDLIEHFEEMADVNAGEETPEVQLKTKN